MQRVLVVDDEAGVQESLRMLLKQEFDVATAGDVDSALRSIASHPPDLILLDIMMPGPSGLDLLADLKSRGVGAPVVVLTASTQLSVAIEAMKHGAADFVSKPFELDALRLKVRQLLQHSALEHEVLQLRDEVQRRQQLGDMIGRSPAMQDVFRTIERLAESRANVLLTGESGTGKELAARAIHDLGPRAEGPFVAVNCSAINPNLIESELFGHEKGSFTGAHEQRLGRFEVAEGGTLLLDEIGELDPAVQVKLLRAIQERVIERVGGGRAIPVDLRIVAATHRDLEREVAEGRFRQDLFFRISVIPLRMPPLRDRGEDIRLLADHCLTRHAEELGRELRFSSEVAEALRRHDWPGNVRELENAIEHGAALGTLEHPSVIQRTRDGQALTAQAADIVS
jgi:DNA-binding NtrC family response regulator